MCDQSLWGPFPNRERAAQKKVTKSWACTSLSWVAVRAGIRREAEAGGRTGTGASTGAAGASAGAAGSRGRVIFGFRGGFGYVVAMTGE